MSRSLIIIGAMSLAGSAGATPTLDISNLVGSGGLAISNLRGSIPGAAPVIAGGSSGGTPPDSPANRVDPNVATSPFAGVVSLFIDSDVGGFICTGSVISPNHILTAAHCVDTAGNDGIAEPSNSYTVIFNNTAAPALRGVSSVAVHPNYTGFANPALNDDLAILTLSSPIPAGVPTYELASADPSLVTRFVMVGYGLSGDGVAGYTGAPDFFIKRSGQNVNELIDLDDEAGYLLPPAEVFYFDFDGPEGEPGGPFGSYAYAPFNNGDSLGNDIEATLGGGDSGGPSFLTDDFGNLVLGSNGNPQLFGVNTFTFGSAPFFDMSGGGGMLISGYKSWINATVPDAASTLSLLGLSMLALGGLRRRL